MERASPSDSPAVSATLSTTPPAEASLFEASPWTLPELRAGSAGDTPPLRGAEGTLCHVCNRCFAIRNLRLGLNLTSHDAVACSLVELELETIFARLAATISQGEFRVPARVSRTTEPHTCTYCARTAADRAMLTLEGAMSPVCRACWHSRHLRLLSRFLPTGHPDLAALDETLARCAAALRHANAHGTDASPPARTSGVRSVAFLHPDEHFDGGPVPGPFFWLQSPGDRAGLTPPTPRAAMRWRYD